MIVFTSVCFLIISAVQALPQGSLAPYGKIDDDIHPKELDNPIFAYGGSFAKFVEFPFMAVLQYQRKNGEIVIYCGGTLISPRYVLTAAHCVTGKLFQKVRKLVSVRLGEYDLTQAVDCFEGECADPVLEVNVEMTIAHEGYDPKSKNQHHDIAVVRLDRDVVFTKFIKPVNLPTKSFEPSPAGTLLTVVGWGRTLIAPQSPILVKVKLPVWDQNQCAEKFKKQRKMIVSSNQICAGGIFREDSCDRDSGGPLLAYRWRDWTIEGVVSVGNRCGLEGWPGVYTRVSSYLDWIYDKTIGHSNNTEETDEYPDSTDSSENEIF